MTEDARVGERDGLTGYGDVAELLVFVAEAAVFEAAMQAGALDSRREVAPVGFHEGAGHRGGARRGHVCAESEQVFPDGADAVRAARRARLDDDYGNARGGPETGGEIE